MEQRIKRQKLLFEELVSRRSLPSEAYFTEVPPWISTVTDSSKASQYDAEATRLRVAVGPLLSGSGALLAKNMQAFVELLGDARLEGEVQYATSLLAKVEQHAVKMKFIDCGGLDRLMEFIVEGTRLRLPNVVLWTLKVLEKLPPVESLLKHKIASTVKNLSTMEKDGAKDLRDAALTVLRVWLKERNSIAGKPTVKAAVVVAAKPPPAAAAPKPPPPKKSASASSREIAKSVPAKRVSAVAAPRPATKPVSSSSSSSSTFSSSSSSINSSAPVPARASMTSSFSSSLVGGGETARPPVVIKKKKRSTIALSSATETEKKPRLLAVDANGDIQSDMAPELPPTVAEEGGGLVLSADDLIARQKKPGRLGGPLVDKKPQTTAAIVARMRDEKMNNAIAAVNATNNAAVNNGDFAVAGTMMTADDGMVVASEAEAVALIETEPKKTKKRVSFAPDDKLAEIRKYTPENPSQMLSTRSALSGIRQLSKLDVMHERTMLKEKNEEASAKEIAKRMEPQIPWTRPIELRIVFSGDDEPPKRGEESSERLVQKAREEARLGRMYNDRNPPPDDPTEPPPEPEADDSRAPVVWADGPAETPVVSAPSVSLLPSLVNPLASLFSNPTLNALIENAGGVARPAAPVFPVARFENPIPQPPPPLQQGAKGAGHCHFWDHGRGHCRFGNQCKFVHD